MNLHRWLDVWGQRRMWRYRTPSVESTPADAERLLQAADEELHPPVGPAKLALLESRASGGVREDRFTFPSPAPSGDAAVDAVHCVRLRRAGAEAGRALVAVHGAYAAGHRKTLTFLPPVERTGWDVFLMELPHHMRRQCARSEYSGQHMVTSDIVRLVRGMHQGEADIRALVLGLRREGYRRVVLGGFSLGGNAVLQAVTRVRVDGAFAIVPAADAYASLWESVLGECIASEGRAAGFTDDMASRVLRLITPLHMGRPATPAERILLVYGRHDLLCPPGPIEELGRAWGDCPARVLDAGHVTLILRFRAVRRIVAAWMKAVAGA